MLNTYDDFVNRVDTLGFMSFSNIVPGWTSLSGETSEKQWHTGDTETDPWHWKDRAAQEKRLAFGCIMNGHKGFISAEWYPIFYAAYRPSDSIEERWEAGEINHITLRVWQLFNEGISLGTDDIRRMLCVTKKNGAGTIDTKIKLLQSEFMITVSGNRRKLNLHGEPYGWPSNTYERVIDWAPQDWLEPAKTLSKETARQKILSAVCTQIASPDIKRISKTLGL